MIIPALVILTSYPFFRKLRMFRTKVLMLEQKKIFQVSPNDQKVLGCDISYINSVPPIGDPKAAATPAAAPAQAISRLSFSLRYRRKDENGR